MIDGMLTIGRILEVFTDEVKSRKGRVTDKFQDRRRLFVRSLLPHVADARPKDRMQGGLALRATDDELWLHPYLFRQVCRNGAVVAQAIESLHVEYLGVYSVEEGTTMLREAIAKCAEQRVFARSMRQVRLSMTVAVDWLNMLPYLAHFESTGIMGRTLATILERFDIGADRTRFGVMNAVTSVARDTRDPDEKWRLEELGGSIGARLRPRQPSDAPGVERTAQAFVPVA
ncbi:MAG TPA: hypothetical protein VHK01_00875 [Lacipirellulaceae bacterium]|jgi:hypothetical protein|nr:hypothetical protein [Lacipirellulaceae bacterium]